ncbi:MAG TPA: dihydrofolate reductase family protein, partial [Solirubrobacterales bacterium]
ERYAGLDRRLVVVRSGEGEWADLRDLLGNLRAEGVRAVMCEGGPTLHASLQAEGLVDELFLTIAPKLSGGAGPSILEGALPAAVEMELAWLLESDGELFARYRRA